MARPVLRRAFIFIAFGTAFLFTGYGHRSNTPFVFS
jgi:hypothetical protein